MAQADGHALELGRLLDGTVGGQPALDRHQLDRRGGCRQARPEGLRDDIGLGRHASAAGHEVRPASGQVVVRLGDAGIGALLESLLGVARVCQDDDLVGGHQEPTRVAGHLLLTVAELESGQVAGMLGPDAEVDVHSLALHARPEAAQPGRPGGTVGRRPPAAIGLADQRAAGRGCLIVAHGSLYLRMLARCSS